MRNRWLSTPITVLGTLSATSAFADGYQKGMAVFTVAKGGLMDEATIGGRKFSYKPKK